MITVARKKRSERIKSYALLAKVGYANGWCNTYVQVPLLLYYPVSSVLATYCVVVWYDYWKGVRNLKTVVLA
jgi:hypothetical protein